MLTKFLAGPAVLAAASLVATPAAAVDGPVARSEPVAQSGPIVATSNYGPYVGAGWGWGGGYRDRHHRRGSSVGDILTGVLILGTIAAVANAANRARERRSYPERYPHPDRFPQPDRRGDYRPNGPQGLEGAADMCLREVERDARAREVSRVERNAGGWLVTGSMADGAAFSCSIGGDGRIESIDVGGRARTLGGNDRQHDDERYRSARAATGGQSQTGPQPAYPGGPLPGEDAEAETPES